MGRFGYSIIKLDPDKTAKASGRELDISHKHAREICKAIKGMLLDDAKNYLEDVIAMKRSVPFRRFKKKVGHRKDLQGFATGRYPVKAAKYILDVLKNVENNAEFKGLELDRCVIIHAAAYPGRKVRNIFPRAFGRSSPKINTLTHVEIAVEEL